MSAALLLSDLAPDVIFSIFAYCDIASVVSAGQTCRYLHDLAFDKSVWLGLFDSLRRSYRGRAAVNKKITLHPTIRTGPGILDWENEAKLLPSGRYVLFNNCERLECWNVADDRLVWRHTSPIEHAAVKNFAAEETDIESTIIMIMVCIRTYPHNQDRLNYVEIVSVDLQTGTHNCLLTARAPDSGHDNLFSDPVICGAFAAVSTNARSRNEYMIVNWRTQSFFVVQGHPYRTQNCA
ncbi:hypothetical protein B0H12DRAFT_225125 [Mycena haematopus]|nr:hypothetical protein B0H12DRAFT_225125 [Mycena haematopus]